MCHQHYAALDETALERYSGSIEVKVSHKQPSGNPSSVNDAMEVLESILGEPPAPAPPPSPVPQPVQVPLPPKQEDPLADHTMIMKVLVTALKDPSAWVDDDDKTIDQFENLVGVGLIQDKKDSFLLGYSGSKRSHSASSSEGTTDTEPDSDGGDDPDAKRTKFDWTSPASDADSGQDMPVGPSTFTAGRDRARTLVPPKRTQGQSSSAGTSTDVIDDDNPQTTPKKGKKTMATKRGSAATRGTR